MEVLENFTCISYDCIDFLIPSKYVVSGMHQRVQEDTKNVVFNRETLPHLHIGGLLEKEFLCRRKDDVGIILVMKMQDFESDVCNNISDYTDTAFPASGNLALSVNGEICSMKMPCSELSLMPYGIRERMTSCGVDAIRFLPNQAKQVLVSPDLLIRKFFSGALL